MRQLDIYLLASQATLQSYDMAGHYPDLLDIPNRDLQTSPTTTAAGGPGLCLLGVKRLSMPVPVMVSRELRARSFYRRYFSRTRG